MDTRPHVVLCSVPFEGHVGVLRRLQDAWRGKYDVTSVIFGWRNVAEAPCDHYLRADYDFGGACASTFNLRRAAALATQAQALFETLLPIDWIVYDFFAIEAALASRRLRIPSVCSIPAVVGPEHGAAAFRDARIAANSGLIREVEDRWGVPIRDHLGQVSDGFLLRGDIQMLWHPPAFYADPPAWLGRRIHVTLPVAAAEDARSYASRDTIYLCFGTVLTGTRWQHNAAMRTFILTLYRWVIDFFAQPRFAHYNVVISAPGHTDQIRAALGELPGNVRIVPFADQAALLARAALFITHGGGNSVGEALQCGAPLLVIPFTGDQHESAARVDKLGIGVALHHDDPVRAIDRHQQDFFRTSLREPSQLARAIETALQRGPDMHATIREVCAHPGIDARKINLSGVPRRQVEHFVAMNEGV